MAPRSTAFTRPIAVALTLLLLLTLTLAACGGGDDDSGGLPLPGQDGGSNADDDDEDNGSGDDDDDDDGSDDDGGDDDGGLGSADFEGDVCALLPEDAIKDALDITSDVEGIETPYDGTEGSCAYVSDGIPILLAVTIMTYDGADAGWEDGFGYADAEDIEVNGAEAKFLPLLQSVYVKKHGNVGVVTYLGQGPGQAVEDVTTELAQELADNMP